MSLTVFLCGRKQRRMCPCGHVALYMCEFAFRGRGAGKTCQRALCADCAVTMPRGALHCATHAAMVKAETAR